jgi:hypothetical protein
MNAQPVARLTNTAKPSRFEEDAAVFVTVVCYGLLRGFGLTQFLGSCAAMRSQETALTMYFIGRTPCLGRGLLGSASTCDQAWAGFVNRTGPTHIRYYRGSLSLRLAAERVGRSHLKAREHDNAPRHLTHPHRRRNRPS